MALRGLGSPLKLTEIAFGWQPECWLRSDLAISAALRPLDVSESLIYANGAGVS